MKQITLVENTYEAIRHPLPAPRFQHTQVSQMHPTLQMIQRPQLREVQPITNISTRGNNRQEAPSDTEQSTAEPDIVLYDNTAYNPSADNASVDEEVEYEIIRQ